MSSIVLRNLVLVQVQDLGSKHDELRAPGGLDEEATATHDPIASLCRQ
jgi:hypothetical protein